MKCTMIFKTGSCWLVPLGHSTSCPRKEACEHFNCLLSTDGHDYIQKGLASLGCFPTGIF